MRKSELKKIVSVSFWLTAGFLAAILILRPQLIGIQSFAFIDLASALQSQTPAFKQSRVLPRHGYRNRLHPHSQLNTVFCPESTRHSSTKHFFNKYSLNKHSANQAGIGGQIEGQIGDQAVEGALDIVLAESIDLISPYAITSTALSGLEGLAHQLKKQLVSVKQNQMLNTYYPLNKRLQIGLPVYTASSTKIEMMWAMLKKNTAASYSLVLLLVVVLFAGLLRAISWVSPTLHSEEQAGVNASPKQSVFWPLA